MTASKKTICDIVEVLLRHIDAETALKIANDLVKVRGNASFTETVKQLSIELSSKGEMK